MKRLFQKDPRFSDTRNPGLLKTKTKRMLGFLFVIWMALFLMVAGKMWNRGVVSSAAKKIAKSTQVVVTEGDTGSERQYAIASLLQNEGASVRSYPLSFETKKKQYEDYLTDEKVTFTFYQEGKTKKQAALELIRLEETVQSCEALRVEFAFDITDPSYFCYYYRLGEHLYALKVNGDYAYLNVLFVKGLWNLTMQGEETASREILP